MHPAEMLFIGTLGGARALDMEDRFGNFDVGKEADFVVVDPAGTPLLGGQSDERRCAPPIPSWPGTDTCSRC